MSDSPDSVTQRPLGMHWMSVSLESDIWGEAEHANFRNLVFSATQSPAHIQQKLRLRFYASDHERQIAGAWPLQWLEDNAVIRVDVGRHHAHLVGDRWRPAHAWYLHSHRTWLNVRILLVFRQTRDRIHARAGSQRAGSAGTVQNCARTVGEGGQADAAYLYRPNHESQCVRNGTQ